jgi:AcrR family transcriptional regulator
MREKSIDPRAKRTRKLLQQALMELLQERNFTGISILDITERASINRATFYAHFPDKYALLNSMLREQFQQTITSQFPTKLKWEEANVRTLIRSLIEFLDDVQRLCKPFIDTQFELLVGKIVQQEVAYLLLDWLKDGPGLKTSPRVHPKTVVSAMSWVIFGMAIDWTFNTQMLDERVLSPDEITNQMFLVLTEGVAQHIPGLYQGRYMAKPVENWSSRENKHQRAKADGCR